MIDDDPRELAAFERVLRRRYSADYRVMAERSPKAGLDLLKRLAHRGDDVALVAADLRLPGWTASILAIDTRALRLQVPAHESGQDRPEIATRQKPRPTAVAIGHAVASLRRCGWGGSYEPPQPWPSAR